MFRSAFIALLAMFAGAVSAAAQTATLTAAPTALSAAGGQIAFSFSSTFSGGPAFFTFEVALPAGWTYLGGANEPGIKPAVNAQASPGNPLSWTALSALPSPVQFTFNASYPASAPAVTLTSAVTLRQTVQVTVTDKSGATTTETREVVTPITPAPIAFGIPPTITTQPQNAAVNVGAAANFSVVATGSAPLSYQWFKSGASLAGATNTSLAIASAQTSDAGNYTVVVTNPAGTITSSAAVFTVNAPSGGGGGGGGIPIGGGGGGGIPIGGGGGTTATAPTISAAPASQTIAAGGNASFSVTAAGTSPFTYQWLKNGVAISGATGASLSFASAQVADAGSYAVTVTNSAGSITSSAATLSVTAAPAATAPVPPTIAAQSSGTTVAAGVNASFSVTAAGDGPFTYQWRRDGALISGASGASLSIAAAALTDAGNYTATVTSRVGSITSAPMSLTVTPAATRPAISVQPQNLSSLAGASVSFAVAATGTPPLTYQWQKNGAAIAGATSATLALANLSATDAASYIVVVTNSLGSTPSNPATLTLAATGIAPRITAQPAGVSAAPGASATLSVAADGTAPFTYQWRKNGAVVAGATSAVLTFANLRLADAGSYSVTVANSTGTATSSTATLTVAPPPGAPAILADPVDVTIGAGAHVTFRATASGTDPLSYEWRKNGAAIAGGSALTLANVQASDAAVYTVVVSNAFGSATSRAATLAIRGRSYVGSYFGSFGNGGSFALTVRDDNTGVFLGYATGSHTAFVSRDIVVDDSGHFSFVSTASRPSTSINIAAAANEFTISGSIGADGSLAGSIAANGSASTSLSAARSAASGAAQSVAGFYQAGAAGSSATTYTIVSPAGQAFVLTVTPTSTDGGAGTVDATGKVSVTTANGATVSGNVSASSATLTASITTATGTKLDFTGGSDARATTEKLVNIATRGPVGGSAGSLIAGFVVNGDAPKQVLIRAVGPTLGTFGVSGALAAAHLDLFDSKQSPIATNTAWGASTNAADIAAAAVRAGAFALDPASKDAVLLVTLEPGAYTAVVSGESDTSGIALVEVYDVSVNATNAQKVINIASRAFAGSGDSTLTAGFVINGTVPKRVLIRGAGPALAAFGVSGTLVDPQLKLVSQSTAAVVATNDNWTDTADASAIASAAGSVGAFAFSAGSKDAALLLNLSPGAYTVQLSGAGTTTGTALIEVYEVP